MKKRRGQIATSHFLPGNGVGQNSEQQGASPPAHYANFLARCSFRMDRHGILGVPKARNMAVAMALENVTVP